MLIYWIMFVVFAVGAVVAAGSRMRKMMPGGIGVKADLDLPPMNRSLVFLAFLTSFIIGLRFEVGADWSSYVIIFQEIVRGDFAKSLTRIDPAYGALNWLAGRLGFEIWAVNLVCGFVFMLGVARFATQQPNPWLVLAVATPYLFIVVGMGFTRQAVAIGLALAGLAALSRGSFIRFIVWVLLGALFHRSAVILIPIVALAYSRNRFQIGVISIIGGVASYYILTSGQGLEHFQRQYIAQRYEAEGAVIRLAMNALPALFLLAFPRRFTTNEVEWRTWRNFALLAIAAFVGWLFIGSNTALDRMGLYLIPLQLFVFSRIPTALSNQARPSGPLLISVLSYSALVQFVWLNFAHHAHFWIPYQFYPTS
jgi:hypothetical protein